MKVRFPLQDEANPDNPGGGGAAATTTTTNTADAGGGGEKKETPPKETSATEMQAAIDKGLGYTKDDPAAAAAAAAGEKKAVEEKKAEEAKQAKEAADWKALEDKANAGDETAKKELATKKTAEEEAAKKAKAEAAKPKDLAKLELSADEKKAVGAKTAARFGEVLEIAKIERARAEKAESSVKALAETRDAILGVLKDTQTSDEDLVQLLEWNRLVKTGTPESLELALKVVDAQRLGILKLLGKPGEGHDPMKEFPDLEKEVAEDKITRERALEIAGQRRKEAMTKARETREGAAKAAKTEAEKKAQQAVDIALSEIDAWTAEVSGKDIDYKAKEARLLADIDAVINEYPPHLWLPTIKRLYGAIEVQKAAPAAKREEQPLRSSGAKPGGPAPTSMQEAIDQGLGYAKTG